MSWSGSARATGARRAPHADSERAPDGMDRVARTRRPRDARRAGSLAPTERPRASSSAGRPGSSKAPPTCSSRSASNKSDRSGRSASVPPASRGPATREIRSMLAVEPCAPRSSVPEHPGFYTADQLLGAGFEVDLFDSLPTPFGLVRAGVAPDHPKIKSACASTRGRPSTPRSASSGTSRSAEQSPRGAARALQRRRLRDRYRARPSPGHPGRGPAGLGSGTEFVAWYNGHPDYPDHEFDLQPNAQS